MPRLQTQLTASLTASASNLADAQTRSSADGAHRIQSRCRAILLRAPGLAQMRSVIVPPMDDVGCPAHRATSTCSPVRLVLFDVDGTLVDRADAAATTTTTLSYGLR
jgi:hypothetical protein